MAKESQRALGTLDKPVLAAETDQSALEGLGWHIRVVGRTLSRSWVLRVAAAAAGLAVGRLLSHSRAQPG